MRTNPTIAVKLSAGIGLAIAILCVTNTANAQSRYRFVKSTPKTPIQETIERPAFEDSDGATIENLAPRIDDVPQTSLIKPLASQNSSAIPRHTGALDTVSGQGLNQLNGSNHRQVNNNELDSNKSDQMIRVASMANEAQPITNIPESHPASTIYYPATNQPAPAYPAGALEPLAATYPGPRFQSQSNTPFRDQFKAFDSGPVSQTDYFPSHAPQSYGSTLFGDDCGCCDEWSGFCNCKDVEYGCGCGGLKTNPGHLGMRWLKGNDPCEGEKRCGLNDGCNSCTPKAGGLFSAATSLFHKSTPKPNGCDSCLPKLRGNAGCGCEPRPESSCNCQPEPQPCNGCQNASPSCNDCQSSQGCNDCRTETRRSSMPSAGCGCGAGGTSRCGCKSRRSNDESVCEPNFFSKSNR